jgi:uncharacterized protein (DUF1501 family)
MNRRDFLKYSLYTGMMTSGTAALGLRTASAQAMGTPYGRTLVHVMLLGGADLRYLFVPDPGAQPEYAAKFWEARQSIYQDDAANTALYPDYATVFSNLYTPASDTANGTSFGINNNAAWLKQQFDLGNVAIVANVLGSANRRHDHSQLIVHTGDVLASQYIYDREGWGGRLAYGMNAANAVAVSNDISVFCNGIDPANRNARVVHASDTRNFGFSAGDGDPLSDNSVMARALKAYYAEKQIEAATQPANWPYRKFLQHEQALRGFGDAFNARLAEVSPIQPAALAALYTAGSGNTLNSSNFGQQCANVYDSFLGADLFQQRIVSMEYTGWDTHRMEKNNFESNIVDIFGTGKGLDTLTAELEPLGVNDEIVYVFNTDFGRQLHANGDYGTDHGRGNYTILVGRGVNGGVYGEMFPASEIEGAAGSTRFDQQGADIEGRTSFERVLAAACDWTEAGTGAQVFPGAATSAVEVGVDPATLFA